MITICPQCQLPLAVTAADLRIAQGQVRCGRCAAVFNALASLYEPGNAASERRVAAVIEATRAAAAVGAPAAAQPPTPTTTGAGAAAAPAQPPAFWSPVGSSPFAPRRGNAPAAAAATPVAESVDQADGSAAAAAPTAATPAPAPPEPRASTPDTTILGPNSGLFRAPPRDDVPRFDDTHGADDWPADLPEQLAAVAADEPAEPITSTTDAFLRAPDADDDGPRTDALVLPGTVAPPPQPSEPAAAAPRASVATPPGAPAPALAPAAAPTAAPSAIAPVELSRDWNIDTMTAAELAALVARSDSDEPPELASIRIAVDEASEITVLPGDMQGAAPERALAPDASLPRLLEPLADDPDLPGARAAAEERRAALPDAAMRWLEIEPAASLPAESRATPSAAGLRHDDTVDPPATWRAIDAPANPHDADPARGADFDFASVADAAPRPAADDGLVEELVAGAATRPATPRWMFGGTIALGLLLVAQLVHRYREELVEMPLLEAPLGALYAALGTPVQPRWDVGRYEVRQQGVVAEPIAAGTLTVRASIRNGAGRAQPAPLLRVILQDRFGNRIATRDLTPREYGGTAALAPAPMLAPGQRIDAEVSLLDPGGDAVGFELDVCLRRTDTSVRCANDAPAANG